MEDKKGKVFFFLARDSQDKVLFILFIFLRHLKVWVESNESDMPIGLWSPSSPWTGPLFYYRGEEKSPGKLENELFCQATMSGWSRHYACLSFLRKQKNLFP